MRANHRKILNGSAWIVTALTAISIVSVFIFGMIESWIWVLFMVISMYLFGYLTTASDYEQKIEEWGMNPK